MSQDRNFEDITLAFQKRIKQSKKGLLREALLREDLQNQVLAHSPSTLRILDGGCGFGDMSVWLAEKGHQLVAWDLSETMIEETRKAAEKAGLSSQVQADVRSIQEGLPLAEPFDLICVHAVLEWLSHPLELIPLLKTALKEKGFVSLSFYNHHRSVFNALIKGSFQAILKGNFAGRSNALTPPGTVKPEDLIAALEKAGFTIQLYAGLRCFYDAFSSPAKDLHSLEDLLLLERQYRHQSPYRDIARYVHIIAQKR